MEQHRETKKKHCNICNSLITGNKMNRHKETYIRKKKSLLRQVFLKKKPMKYIHISLTSMLGHI